MSTSNEFSEERLLSHVSEVLELEPIRDAIREDLNKIALLGYKESWKLGLITPETDWVFMGTDIQPIPPEMSRLDAAMHIARVQPSMMALLYPVNLFGFKSNSLQVDLGNMASVFQNTYPLVKFPGKREYMPIEQITARAPAYKLGWKDSISGVPVLQILRHMGFPLKTEYRDANPLTVKRDGLVDSQGIVHRPAYFLQRSLIDDEGNLLYLGLDNTKAILAAGPQSHEKRRPTR